MMSGPSIRISGTLSRIPGVNVMVDDFCQFSAKKFGVFLDHFVHERAVFGVKMQKIFSTKFCRLKKTLHWSQVLKDATIN
jgi:hypothetical protein